MDAGDGFVLHNINTQFTISVAGYGYPTNTVQIKIAGHHSLLKYSRM